jgi:tmRNA-binding protein
MKEDHMRNGQLKPGYNVQISTNNQFIASYSLHPNPTDTKTLIPHLQQHIKSFKQKPANVTADAGYGSEENYQWMEDKRITAYVKHNYFDRNQKASRRNPFATENFLYDVAKKRYYCPAGKAMKKTGTGTQLNRTGYLQHLTLYQAKGCAGCPLRKQCHQQKGDRIIKVNNNLNRLKQQADKRLKTKRGIQKRKQRCCDTEPVFAQIKHNHHFRRFLLRGIDKVTIEIGLLALAHNLRKKAA